MNIQPIPYGLNKNAVAITLEWCEKPFFSDNVKLKINLFDDSNNPKKPEQMLSLPKWE